MPALTAPEDSLDALNAEVRTCTLCDLCKTRTKAVPGEGPAHPEILLIGEGPGLNEDRQGRPFVGAAGQFLDELMAGASLKRADCFITNVVKCRPPNNRDPLPDEIAACAGYLDRQIALLQPKLIVTLGRFSMAKFFPGEKIGTIHGKVRTVHGQMVLPMYHPAAALHQASLRDTIIEDFKQAPPALQAARQQPPAKPEEATKKDEPPPEQLSLF
jgi:uracil-DNA glycosylase